MSHAQASNIRYVYNGMVPVAHARRARQNSKKFQVMYEHQFSSGNSQTGKHDHERVVVVMI